MRAEFSLRPLTFFLFLFHDVANQHVARLNVVKAFEVHPAFKSLTDLFYVFFFMTQGGEITFVHNIRATLKAYLCAASEFAVGNFAACNLSLIHI